MTFNCENKCFHLLRAGVSAAKIHTHPGNSPAPFYLLFLNVLKYIYIFEPFKIFFLITHFLSLQLIVVVTIILPKEKDKEEKYILRSLATYSF